MSKIEKEDKWSTDVDWMLIAILMSVFAFNWGDNGNSEEIQSVKERVARLEGQMDMIRR